MFALVVFVVIFFCYYFCSIIYNFIHIFVFNTLYTFISIIIQLSLRTIYSYVRILHESSFEISKKLNQEKNYSDDDDIKNREYCKNEITNFGKNGRIKTFSDSVCNRNNKNNKNKIKKSRNEVEKVEFVFDNIYSLSTLFSALKIILKKHTSLLVRKLER